MPFDSKAAVGLVVTLFVAALMGAFLMPVVIDSMGGQEETTVTQDVGETVELQPSLNATVTSVTSGTSATYDITANGDTTTTTVNVGSNQTVTVDGTDVTISPSEVTSTNATTTYNYSGTYGWGGSAAALWGILPIILVLALFLFVTYLAVGRM